MLQLPNLHRFRIIILTMILVACLGLTANQVQAQVPIVPTPTAVVADGPSMLEKIGLRLGSIFFQNMARSVINDFAYDAATYIGSGGKGQQALFIKEKWGNFWENVGDKAAGDFVETLAKTIISDVASSQNERAVAGRCEAAYTSCAATAGTDPEALAVCTEKRDKCLGSVKSEEQQEAECDQQVKACKSECDGTMVLSKKGSESCLRNCEITYNYCWSKVGAARKAPTFNADNSPLANVNICNPRLDVLIQIQFGLSASINGGNRGPYQPNCSFSQMMNNWKNEFDRQKAAITTGSYLNDLVVQFRPGYNDVGVALQLQSSLGNYRTEASLNSKAETTANGGWLDLRNFAGDLLGTPEEAASRKNLTDEKLFENLDKVTGDILVDAANIFINQLLVTGWQNLIGNIADTTSNSSPVSYWSAVSPGRKAIENKISQIKDPVYSDGKRLNILADLSSCQKPEDPGPTNCVIDTNFSNAITNKMTVAEAMDGGSLQRNWPFGFDKNGQENIQYNQGYPYRSMLILRKYRIVPVGWELAAQKIQQSYLLRDGRALNPNNANALVASVENDFVDGKLKDGVSLEDMVSCFTEGDKYNTYYADWCKGLVDPNWVLELPDYYCARQGYGPALVQDFDIQDSAQKSCGEVDANGNVSKVFVDGGYRTCSVDADCCTKGPNADCSATCIYKEAKLLFTRSNDYCADEQSCLKEDDSGKCLSYGYCTEERRQWTFDQKGQDKRCEPYYNTCKSYTGNGLNISYLENTLDFNNCTADNSGCREYLIPDDYNQADRLATWSDNAQAIYFDGQVSRCDKSNEGCRQLIRTRIDGGANLIADAGFEAGDDARWDGFGSIYDNSDPGFDQQLVASGGASLRVSGVDAGVYFTPTDKRLLPKGFEFESNQTYSLSANVYVVSGLVEIGIGDLARDNFTSVEATAGGWKKYTVTIDNDFSLQANSLKIAARGTAEFYLDDLKLEIGGPTEYTDYGAADTAYQKLLPNYLERTCYVNPPVDYSLKADAPELCSTFVRRCNKDEIGCNLFTDILNKDQIAAKVKPKDYCPGECVGYDKFIQQANNFYSARLTHFIPRTAKTCTANQEGCSLFVNLDKVPEGGEENEAYSSFRRCIKPDDSCSEFITWEGSDVSGYQITSFKLQANDDNTTISQPRTVVDANQLDSIDTDENGEELCSETIFKLSADHPRANSDCRQFFGKDGNVSYHLYSKTVICVDDCYFYRQVEPNIDQNILTESECNAVVSDGLADPRGKWLADEEACVVCREGGTWDETHQSCVFRAWPNESTTCAKTAVGCSKYVGDTGHNLRIIFNDTFEANNNGNWSGNNGQAQISNDALSVGGHSIQVNDSESLTKNLSTAVRVGKKYTLSFMARRRDQAARIEAIKMKIDERELDFTNGGQGLELGNRWKSYKFVIDNIDATGSLNQVQFVGMTNSAEIRIDDIKLIEAEDIYYLIKNSWQTPESCDQDHRGRPFPAYMSGCRAYTDMNGEVHNLRSFDELCQNSAAGCELMIDTFNSSVYGQLDTNGISVPADEMAYVVYDPKKTCQASQKGCQYLGRTNRIGALSNLHLINNPDIYNDILCAKNALYCETWNQDGNNVYFKDPGDRVCEYLSLEGGTEGWYVKKQQYCFANQTCSTNTDCGDGMACLTDDKGAKYCSNMNVCGGQSDCESGQVCKFTSENTACPTTPHKTIGLGVAPAKYQPYGMADLFTNAAGQEEMGYAGICQNSLAGCTEYIDPESKFNYNLLLDGASSVKLKPDTLYLLKSGLTGEAIVRCSGAEMYQIDHGTNELVSVTEVKAVSNEGKVFGQEFYAHNPTANGQEISCSVSGDATAIREAVVAYRIKDSIARETPTIVKFDEGKILFNERSQNGKSKKALVYSSDLTADGSAPSQIDVNPPGNNANTLLAVDPDRTCSQWLACKTYIFNPAKPNERICIERGLCDRLNDANECSHFVDFEPVVAEGSSSPINQLYGASAATALNLGQINNMSGYSLVGYDGSDWNSDYYHLAGMQEVGNGRLAIDNGGSFEGRSTTGFKTATGADVPTINDPKLVEKELGIAAYREVPDGQSIGKMNRDQAFIELNNPGTVELIASMKVFLRTGSKVSLRIGAGETGDACPSDSGCSAGGQPIDGYGANSLVAEATEVGKWVPLTGKFAISEAYGIDNKLKLWLISDGVTYFDDLKIEPALTYRSQSNQEQFMQSVCRLFPRGDSLSCDYFDNSGLRRKGWSGYCLQYDPRNAQQCLLWYPIDKVAGDEFEEGASLSIDKDLYYCVEAEDRCGATVSGGSPVVPEFACKTFVKVDKDKYWHGRIGEGSSYLLKPEIFNPVGGKLMVDFGVDNGSKKPGGKVEASLSQGIDWRQGSGFYGAYSIREALDSPNVRYPIFAGVSGTANAKKILPFVPFFGTSRAGAGGKDDAYFCRATIDEQGRERPIEVNDTSGDGVEADLGVYDSCYVEFIAEWDDCTAPSGRSDNYACCESWDPIRKTCSSEGDDPIDNCGDSGFCYCDNRFLFPGFSPTLNGCKKYQCWDNEENEGGRDCRDWPYPADAKITMNNNGDNDPGLQCRVLIPRTGSNSSLDTYKAFVEDMATGLLEGNQVGCLFGCYNFTKAFNIGSSLDRAYYAIQRLFTGQLAAYSWNDTASKYEEVDSPRQLQAMSECVTRAEYDADQPLADYCYIKPTVNNVKVTPARVVNQGYVTLTFTSKVDAEQLPLKRVVVHYMGKGGGKSRTFNLSIFDHRDPANPHKFLLNYNAEELGLEPGQSRTITPCVEVYDNWYDAQSVLADPSLGGEYMKSDIDAPGSCVPLSEALVISRSN